MLIIIVLWHKVIIYSQTHTYTRTCIMTCNLQIFTLQVWKEDQLKLILLPVLFLSLFPFLVCAWVILFFPHPNQFFPSTKGKKPKQINQSIKTQPLNVVSIQDFSSESFSSNKQTKGFFFFFNLVILTEVLYKEFGNYVIMCCSADQSNQYVTQLLYFCSSKF